ncbi:SDR family oxidoreductase [Paenibacillus glycinis]|uniref:SDR family oxidoreductase n=1 Tax=Paenibacillus glycinis TaxID=2697035 RepID=A0ABW9XR91_9BACL|nr:SDR family oxidoreductase [Paenibacillus glycinis]NBD25163.1 SDR family oxidoreductase [Paenibacillus glycinis]
MNKAVLMTKSGRLFNRDLLGALLAQGCSVAMVADEPGEAEAYGQELPEPCRERFFPIEGVSADEAGIRDAVDRAALRMGGLHVLIHGLQARDEEAAFVAAPAEFGIATAAELRSRFLYSRAAAAHMAREKAGHILFLLLADSLYYAGYPASPVMNHGSLAMMRSLAKELSPFRIAVNAVTYGYYADAGEQGDRKELKQQLEIHTLKPYLPEPRELAEASLSWLLQAPERLVSGQNIHIGAGMDTGI